MGLVNTRGPTITMSTNNSGFTQKELLKLVIERLEFTDSDYAQAITDLANSKFDQQENGYKTARQEAYGSIADQLDMIYWDGKNTTTTFQDHIDAVKAAHPKPE